MAEGKIKEVIDFLKERLLHSGLNISKIILFGSQASGTATAESDIDVIILSEDFRGKNIFERAEMTKHAEIETVKKFVVPLDIITLTPEEYEKQGTTAPSSAREGEVVYEKK